MSCRINPSASIVMARCELSRPWRNSRYDFVGRDDEVRVKQAARYINLKFYFIYF